VRRVLAVLLLVSVTAVPALADDFGNRQNTRAFWLKNQPWPEPRDRADAAQPRFTKTYMDGIARRFGVGGDHKDFFEQHIGGEGGPGLVGTVEGGAPALALRWHPGE
jgi:hypothetical protein